MSDYQNPGQNDSTFTDENGTVWHHTNSSGMGNPAESCHQTSVKIKAEGRNALLGHLGVAVGANTVYILIALVLNLIVNAVLPSEGAASVILSLALSVLIGIFAGMFEYGLKSIYMNLQYGQEARFSDLFAGLHENQDKIAVIMLILTLINTICTLPAVIAARVADSGIGGMMVILILAGIGAVAEVFFSLVYSQTLYVLLDYPDMKALEALKKSRELMRGRKKRLLYIHLSFIPLWLLSALSLGIAGLWVYAYVQSGDAAFYKKIMEGKV